MGLFYLRYFPLDSTKMDRAFVDDFTGKFFFLICGVRLYRKSLKRIRYTFQADSTQIERKALLENLSKLEKI